MRSLALIAALSVQSALAASPGDFAMVLPIETDGSGAAWQIELNTEAYHWSQDAGLRDIVIFNAAGKPVPMEHWQVRPTQKLEQQTADLPLFALPTEASTPAGTDLHLIVERDASGRVQRIEAQESGTTEPETRINAWLLDSSDWKEGIDSIQLLWSSPDTGVVARFDVEGSNDLQSWTGIRRNATVALFERDGLRIERREIALDGLRFGYLRLHRLDNGPILTGMTIQARRQHHSSEFEQRDQWLDAAPVQSLAGMQGDDTHHLYTLPAAVPASRLRIDLASDNSLAQLDISTPVATTAGATNWIHHARFVAYRLRQADAKIDSGEIRLPAARRMRALRIDSTTALAQPPRVQVGYTPERFIFLAEGEGPFVLAAGSRLERRPNYPVEAAISSLRKQFGTNWQPPLARLGSARASAGASALLDPPEPMAWKRWLLWAVLIGAAALVGGIALSLLRSSSQGGAEDRQQPPEK